MQRAFAQFVGVCSKQKVSTHVTKEALKIPTYFHEIGSENGEDTRHSLSLFLGATLTVTN